MHDNKVFEKYKTIDDATPVDPISGRPMRTTQSLSYAWDDRLESYVQVLLAHCHFFLRWGATYGSSADPYKLKSQVVEEK